jgi:hypothetical protein
LNKEIPGRSAKVGLGFLCQSFAAVSESKKYRFRFDCRQSGSYHFGNTSPFVLISRYFGIAGYSSEMPIPSTDFVASNNRSNTNQTTECLSMRTAWPAARPPHPFFELRAQPFDICGLVSSFLTEMVQQIHSLRASGVMSSQAASAFAPDASAFRR